MTWDCRFAGVMGLSVAWVSAWGGDREGGDFHVVSENQRSVSMAIGCAKPLREPDGIGDSGTVGPAALSRLLKKSREAQSCGFGVPLAP
jgi:hypothetical protein